MNQQTNTRIVLAARPQGEPKPGDFRLERVPVPTPGPGQLLLRNRYLSLDPYQRGRMDAGPSYAPPVQIGEAMEGRTVSEVVVSYHSQFKPGDWVLAQGNWQEWALADGDAVQRKLDTDAAPLSAALGVYGMPGFTAYAGLHEIGKPKAGETLVVAAASGPVGATVGQIARLRGVRVVGIAGGERKRAYVQDELGFDVALDHRAADFPGRLRAAVPDGIDVYFENVGGAVFDAVLPLLNDFARIPVCGTIATYNYRDALPPGPDRLPLLLNQILRQRLTFRGFIQRDFIALFPQFLREMGGWLKEGRIKYREEFVDGLENAPRALIGLLRGENFGKVVVRIAAE